MRLYSAEWIAAFNEAVASVDAGPDVSFRMLQEVHGGPEGTVRIALDADSGRLELVRDPADGLPPQVTVSVAYEDAAALARGELDPAQLLAAGKVKVRGDLSVLVRGQALLSEAAGRLEALSGTTTT